MLPGDNTASSTLGSTGIAVADASSRVGTAIKKPVNFSRLTGYSEEGSVKAVQAYYEPDTALPASQENPRNFGPEDSQHTSRTGRRPLSEELAWHCQRNEIVSCGKVPQKAEEQRHPGFDVRENSKAHNGNNNDDSPRTPHAIEKSMPIKSILKRTEVEQFSEHAASELGESTGSHHTVSESGSGVYDTRGNWHASDADTSCLTEKEVKKLEKKGINPALFVEMKQAKGKSVVGALTGNSFVG